MMCMECNHSFVQQTSTARDTLDFCSRECECEHWSTLAGEVAHAESTASGHQAGG